MDLSEICEELPQIEGQINDIFRALSNGFQKLDKIKDPNRRSRQLEELTDKMRECKRLIKEFERAMKEEESRNSRETIKMMNDTKQSMIKELNSYVALKKQFSRLQCCIMISNTVLILIASTQNPNQYVGSAILASRWKMNELVCSKNNVLKGLICEGGVTLSFKCDITS